MQRREQCLVGCSGKCNPLGSRLLRLLMYDCKIWVSRVNKRFVEETGWKQAPWRGKTDILSL